MKLEPLFTVKNNKLFKIDQNIQISLAGLQIIDSQSPVEFENDYVFITVPWSYIEIQDEQYNEEFLANFRNYLKALDEKNKFAIIIPVVDKNSGQDFNSELFVNAYNHMARRIKDCASVIGLELPEALLKSTDIMQNFMETLAIKHSQYVYFAKKTMLEKLNILDKITNQVIITY